VIRVIGIVFRKRATTGVYPRLWEHQPIADRARSAAAQEATGCVAGRIDGRSGGGGTKKRTTCGRVLLLRSDSGRSASQNVFLDLSGRVLGSSLMKVTLCGALK